MKYIKTFESIGKYKEGDYIIISDESKQVYHLTEKWNMYPYNCAQILDFNGQAYYMETFDVETKKYLIFWLLDEDIERKATEEEILEFETKKNSNKFNI
jgi:hypothetical protein